MNELFLRVYACLKGEASHQSDLVRQEVEELQVVTAALAEERDSESGVLRARYGDLLDSVKTEARLLSGQRLEALELIGEIDLVVTGSLPLASDSGASEKGRWVDAHSDGSGHCYFLSYSRLDAVTADQVEFLLKRAGRGVLRDSAHLKAGQDVDAGIRAGIERSGSFLALWSKHYASSSWCPGELHHALDLRAKRPLRVALIFLDEHPPPVRFSNLLRLAGRARSECEIAVGRLVAEE